ncbi:DUF1476 domain-containing protein [Martelella soudanensis]|uniref:DUF1476 domain-containing protein n=1 Tax=unclassified Martelella TaxID=2629616 RepID=UPI0015DF74A5|nr:MULTISPECIES: DUF1476 domain-containing protein [unclassified Martelella]
MADRIFADRGRAHEAAYSAEQHAQFNTVARRNRMLANWAAELLGREGEQAYISEVMASHFIEAGDADLTGKLMEDFTAAGVEMDEKTIHAKMSEFLLAATQSTDPA